MARETIEVRAAEYFGLERQPRRSIKLSRKKVLLVGKFGIGYFEEAGRQIPAEANFIPLAEDQASDLLDAVGGSLMGDPVKQRKPLSDEMLRILKAVSEGRLKRSEGGLWLIAGAAKPWPRDRKLLIQRGYFEVAWVGAGIPYRAEPRLTDAGRRVLEGERDA